MIRRGQQSRRSVRQARKTTNAELSDQARGSYEPPNRDECVETSWYTTVDDADTIRLEPHIWKVNGRAVDFALMITSPQLDGQWIEQARIDCCHGHVHLHHANGSTTSLAPLHVVDDVAEQLAMALQIAERYAISIRDVKESHG